MNKVEIKLTISIQNHWDMPELEELSIEADFMKSGQIWYTATTWAELRWCAYRPATWRLLCVCKLSTHRVWYQQYINRDFNKH